jgi:hypothetical protein
MANTPLRDQIIQNIRDVDTVLVTVNANPSVDELSAALGLTLLVNKLNKHATAVFSGAIPPAITFLDPQKTFENTVDSLRDFIIALDKEKADHLRYKVDGDLVKIFITPYHTTITDADLEFSSGDYNVELVLAIGVRDEDDLDRALSDHGRIMHDATVVSVSIGADKSTLGTLQWHEDTASSYSEILAELAEGLRDSKNLLDEQIATAFLTGIVAATERFSNEKTSATAMTVAAQLMAAGANQQLIAVKLEEAEKEPVADATSEIDDATDEATAIPEKEDKTTPPSLEENQDDEEPIVDRPAPDGTMVISHERKGDVDEVAEQVAEDNQLSAAEEAERRLSETLAKTTASTAPVQPLDSLESQLQDEVGTVDTLSNEQAENDTHLSTDTPSTVPLDQLPPLSFDELPPVVPPKPSDVHTEQAPMDKPNFGGVLNATSEQAAEDKRLSELEDQNKTILKHDGAKYVGNPPTHISGLNSFNQPITAAEPPSVDLLAGGGPTQHSEVVLPQPAPLSPAPSQSSVADPFALQFESMPAPAPQTAQPEPLLPTLQDIDTTVRGGDTSVSDASQAVAQALESAQSTEDHKHSGLVDVDALPPIEPQPAVPLVDQGSGMPPVSMPMPPTMPPTVLPTPQPQSDLNNLPPLPPPLPPLPQTQFPGQPQSPDALLGAMLPPLPPQPSAAPVAAIPSDPGQFKIPTNQP